jgi:hypothetical protein
VFVTTILKYIISFAISKFQMLCLCFYIRGSKMNSKCISMSIMIVIRILFDVYNNNFWIHRYEMESQVSNVITSTNVYSFKLKDIQIEFIYISMSRISFNISMSRINSPSMSNFPCLGVVQVSTNCFIQKPIIYVSLVIEITFLI